MTETWSDDENTWSADSQISIDKEESEEGQAFIPGVNGKRYSPTTPTSGISPEGCNRLVCTGYYFFRSCPVTRCKLLIILIILFLFIIGTMVPVCIKVIFPYWINTVVEDSSLTLLNSTISIQLQLSTQIRLNIDTPVPVKLSTAPLKIQFNQNDVATGMLPEIDISPEDSSVDFEISGLKILQTLATSELVVDLVQSNTMVPVQIIFNPNIIILGGLTYPTSFNKTLQLPGLYKFFQANYVTISAPNNHDLKLQIHFSSDNPFPYSFVITNLKLSIYLNNGTYIGKCDEQVKFSIGTVTSNQFSLNINMNVMNMNMTAMKEVKLLGQVSFYGNFSNGAGVSGNKTIHQENIPVLRNLEII